MAKGKVGKLVALSAIVGAGAWVYKKYDTIKSMYHKVSIFKGERYEFDTFDGEAIAAMFSGVTIDLSEVEFAEDEVYLDIYAFCSGVRIFIPKDIEVVLEGTNHASGVQLDQDQETTKLRTLYINYNITASGLLITDNIDECAEDSCCDDPDCNDPNCCEPEEDMEETSVVSDIEEDDENNIEEEAFVVDSFEDFEEKFEEFSETDEADMEEVVEDITEEVTDEIIEEFEEELEELKELDNDGFESEETLDEEASEEKEAEPEIEDLLNKAAEELVEAASDVEEAIDEFVVKKEKNFEGFGIDDSEDDFFE